MNRNLHSPTKLTEFARDFDAEPETFLTKFVNKLTNAYNSGYNTVNVPNQSVVIVGSSSSSSSPVHMSRSNSDYSMNLAQHSATVESSSPTVTTPTNEPITREQKSSTPTPTTTTTTSDSNSNDDPGEKV